MIGQLEPVASLLSIPLLIMSKHDTQFGFYQTTQKMMHISQARSGLDCKCTCMDCGESLIAVKNFKKDNARPYFQHHNPNKTNTCKFSGSGKETSLHLRLKYEIQEVKAIRLPDIQVHGGEYKGRKLKSYTAYKGDIIRFDSVLMEKRDGDIIPDCIGVRGGKKLLIEVKVTHGVGEEKLKNIKAAGMACVELYAPNNKTFNEKPSSKIIFNPRNYEWINETQSSKKKVAENASAFFDVQRAEIDQELEQAEKQEERRDIDLRSQRIATLVSIDIQEWESENLDSQAILNESKYEFRDMQTYDPELFERSYPYSEKEKYEECSKELEEIESSIGIACSQFLKVQSEIIRKLTFIYERTYDLDISSPYDLEQGATALYDPDVHIFDHVTPYFQEIASAIYEKMLSKHLSKWIKFMADRGSSFDDPMATFEKTPQFFTANTAITKLLAFGPCTVELKNYKNLIDEVNSAKAYTNGKLKPYMEKLDSFKDEYRKAIMSALENVLHEFYCFYDDLEDLANHFLDQSPIKDPMYQLEKEYIRLHAWDKLSKKEEYRSTLIKKVEQHYGSLPNIKLRHLSNDEPASWKLP